jgi:hypothetical protein
MVGVPLGIRSHVRNRADEPPVALINRFFEKNPINQVEQVALIERPALVEFLDAGPGPGRRLFNQPGFSDGDLFHVSGNELWNHHMEADRTVTSAQVPGFVDGEGSPDIAATDEYLWITDGFELQYTDGTAALIPIVTPDAKPMISLDVFNLFVICVQNQSDRFYWIEPGDVTIDPLNFATAERTPDWILQVRTVGDAFWLLGQKTTEIWRATGDPLAPFQRIEGRLFDRGIWGGTAVRVKDSVMVVGEDGMTYDVSGGPQPVSDPSIAERMRNAIQAAREAQ